jgi:hypothetical protein
MSTTFGIRALVAAAVIGPLRPATAQDFATDSVCPDDAPVVFHRCALEAAQSFAPPRTRDGRPDLGGVWVLPRGQIGGAYEDLEDHPETNDDLGGPTAVVDPPDGRVPIQAWADARRREHVDRYFHHNAACLLSGVPNSMYHGGARQFLQTPDYLVMLTYNAHAYRIVPLDGRAPPGPGIRLWSGASSGRWDGDTLVIETTNLNGRPWLDQRGRFFTEDARVVERLTLVDADTLHYEATIEDPNVFTRPFTIVVPYRRSTVADYEVEELACYENNEAFMMISRMAGIEVFPGVSPEEAREARAAAGE